MFIVHVFIHVKPDCIERFKEATLENAQNSIQEPGIARFDFLAQSDSENHFTLVEVYTSSEAAAQHKETRHYQIWRDTVAPMMAEPRTNMKYSNIAPVDADWIG